MQGPEFTELRAFVAVAERNSFARAAEYLGLGTSTVSQTVRALEERLGVRLLNRTTRKVSLTDAGERLLGRARPALMELDAALGDLRQFRGVLGGTLRLSVSSIAAQIVLAPVLGGFLEAYPAITVDVTVDDEHADIVSGRFDAGIRIGRRVAKGMQMVRVSEPSRLIAIASPAYLARRPAPMSPRDLHEHACISLRNNNRMLGWEFARGKTKMEISVSGPLIVDNMEMMLRAALEGIGIGYTVEAHVAQHLAAGRLVALLRDWSSVQHSYYLYYSARGQLPLALKALIAFFKDKRVGVADEGRRAARRPLRVSA